MLKLHNNSQESLSTGQILSHVLYRSLQKIKKSFKKDHDEQHRVMQELLGADTVVIKQLIVHLQNYHNQQHSDYPDQVGSSAEVVKSALSELDLQELQVYSSIASLDYDSEKDVLQIFLNILKSFCSSFEKTQAFQNAKPLEIESPTTYNKSQVKLIEKLPMMILYKATKNKKITTLDANSSLELQQKISSCIRAIQSYQDVFQKHANSFSPIKRTLCVILNQNKTKKTVQQSHFQEFKDVPTSAILFILLNCVCKQIFNVLYHVPSQESEAPVTSKCLNQDLINSLLSKDEILTTVEGIDEGNESIESIINAVFNGEINRLNKQNPKNEIITKPTKITALKIQETPL
ncbi:hypothetical protein AB837_00279 [bacterium AB1]|nr:hypothetical protein AB837_00279 [bacterium AB1]